jgi:DNA repair protein RadC
MVREPSGLMVPEATSLQMDAPYRVAHLMRSLYGDSPVENFAVFHLNARNAVTSVAHVTTGIVNASIVHPREVYRAAIIGNAVSIIIAHNHPSGDPLPSHEDREVTKMLKKAGEVVGISLLDHVIVGEHDYHSLEDSMSNTF